MTFSPVTTSTSGNDGQYGERGSGVDMFVVHHAATTSLSGVLSMMSSGSREVSANYVVKDNNIVGVVPEEYRSWSLGSAAFDGRAITVETCNSAAGDASGWPISEESYVSLARLIADCSKRYGFPLDRNHVIGHREVYSRYGASYSTACPGGIDLDRLVNMAREAASGVTAEKKPEREHDMYIARVTDWKNNCVLITPNGHRLIGTQAELDHIRATLDIPMKNCLYGQMFATVSFINSLNSTGGVLAVKGGGAKGFAALSAPESDTDPVIEEAKARQLIG